MSSHDAEADRYRQAKAIAHRILDRPARERRAAAEAECGDDPVLLREVLWLLEAAENAAADTLTLDLPAAAVEAAQFNVEAPLPRNYRLLQRLGEGGMGVVHLAERTDGDLRQQVALKLLRLDAGADPAMARRFTTERQILAGLNHKNIAHMVDGGITADGRPFLAMEYVDGERIDEWCRHRSIGLKARIELFLKVCDAVEYAHQHLVIHRDIKPANILVGADGEPKLLDFGIARLLGGEAGDVVRTDSGVRALTLAYASPEQIEGGTLSTATDIYSLGVVLYQLMAGVRPFDHLQSAHLLSNAIVSGEIAPPSRLATRLAEIEASSIAQGSARPVSAAPSRWRWPRRGVPKDVDAIVLKALRRSPAQRYPSVAELAADLRRFLSSRPVRARRGHWPYRLRRFAWRWRWALAVVTAFALLLTGFIFDREAQLQRTQLERDRAEALASFLNDLFENADSLRSRGNQVTVREILDRGAQELLERRDLDPALRRSMLLAMGRAYNALGLGQQALPLLESAQASLPARGGDVLERAAVLSQLSEAYSTSRRTADSIAADARAIEMLSTAEGDHVDELIRLRIRKLHNHGNLLDIPIEDTRRQLHAVLDELLARPDPPAPLLIQAYRALTVAYSEEDTAGQAMAMAERMLEISQRHYGPDDPRLLSSRFAHAMVVAQAEPARAVGLHEALIADYERLTGPSLNLAAVWSNLGVTLSLLGRREESLQAFQRSAEIVRGSAGTENPLYRVAVANIATFHNETGDPEQARTLILDILPDLADEAANGAGSDRVNHAAALKILATAERRLGRTAQAERAYAQAAQVLQSDDHAAFPQLSAEILENLADSRLQLRRHAEAADALDRLDTLNAVRGLADDDPSRLPAAVLRVELLNAGGDRDRARAAAAQAHALACAAPASDAWRQRLRTAWAAATTDDTFECD